MADNITLTDALKDIKISVEKSSASGYLTTPTETTTTVAGTYYPIAGTFVNTILDNFEVGVDKLIYKGTETRQFKALLNVSVSSDISNTDTTVTITKKRSGPDWIRSTKTIKTNYR